MPSFPVPLLGGTPMALLLRVRSRNVTSFCPRRFHRDRRMRGNASLSPSFVLGALFYPALALLGPFLVFGLLSSLFSCRRVQRVKRKGYISISRLLCRLWPFFFKDFGSFFAVSRVFPLPCVSHRADSRGNPRYLAASSSVVGWSLTRLHLSCFGCADLLLGLL